MKTVDQLTSRELEIELLKRKITREEIAMFNAWAGFVVRTNKQAARVRELAIQETLLKSQQK